MPAPDWIVDPIAAHTHSVEVPLEPERALTNGLASPVAPGRTVRTLFRLRRLDPDGSIEGFFTSSELGFVELERTPTCFTGGVATQVWPPHHQRLTLSDPAEWAEWDQRPGIVKAVIDFRTRGGDKPGWSLLLTETRVAASDDAARRAFGAYWFLVSRPSAMIRRRWLRAAAERASELTSSSSSS